MISSNLIIQIIILNQSKFQTFLFIIMKMKGLTAGAAFAAKAAQVSTKMWLDSLKANLKMQQMA